MLEAVVLAGGASSRMGRPKATLTTPDGLLFVVRIVRTLADAGVARVTVVTGVHHDEILAAAGSALLAEGAFPVPVQVVRNPDPDRGQLSSLHVGMDAALGPATGEAGAWSADAMLVTLVDIPLVRVDTVRAVITAWRERRAPITRPAPVTEQPGAPRRGTHGHPVIFDRALFDELRAAPLEFGPKGVVRRHEAAIVNVPVDDTGCFADVDTPEEYQALTERAARR